MLVKYDGKDYTFDLEEIDVGQATIIKRKYGLTMLGLQQGLIEGDPDALRCIYWLMLAQSGEKANIDAVQFKVLKLVSALNDATAAASPDDSEDPKAA